MCYKTTSTLGLCWLVLLHKVRSMPMGTYVYTYGWLACQYNLPGAVTEQGIEASMVQRQCMSSFCQCKLGICEQHRKRCLQLQPNYT